jgi:NAD(P)H-hydrate epimerase
MGRLLGIDSAAVNADRIDCARAFAGRQGVVLVLKGAHTVIAWPDGEIRVNLTGNPGMASGGMGDALTGMIGGFLAQGVEAAAAAGLAVSCTVWPDPAAGARMVGLLASDVIDRLPRTIAELARGMGDAAF